MKRWTILLTTAGIILSFFFTMMAFSPPSFATGAAARSSGRPALGGSSSGASSSRAKEKSPAVHLKSNLAIKAITLKRCLLYVTLANPGLGPVSGDSYAKGTLTLAFSPLKASDRKLTPKTFSATLGKLDSRHVLSRHKDLTINTHVRLTCPLTVTARLSGLTGDSGKGPLTFTKRILPGAPCLPETRAGRPASMTSAKKETSPKAQALTKQPRTVAARERGRVSHLTGVSERPFDLSIARVYVRRADHHLHIVLKNRGRGTVSQEALRLGRLEIRIAPRPTSKGGPGKKAMSASSKASSPSTHKEDHPPLPRRVTVPLNRLGTPRAFSPGREVTYDTGLVLDAPALVTLRLLPLKGDGNRGKKHLTYRYSPGGTARATARVGTVTPRLPKKGSPRAAKRERVTPIAKGAGTQKPASKTVKPSPLAAAASGTNARNQRMRTMDNQPTAKPYLKVFLNDSRIIYDGSSSVGSSRHDGYAHLFKSGPLGASVPFRLSWLLVSANPGDKLKDLTIEIKVLKTPNRGYGDWFTFIRREYPQGIPNTLQFDIRDIFRAYREQTGHSEAPGNCYRFVIHINAYYLPALSIQDHPVMFSGTPLNTPVHYTAANSMDASFSRFLGNYTLFLDYYVETESDNEDHPDPTAFPPSHPERRTIWRSPLIVQGDRVVVTQSGRRELFGEAFNAHPRDRDFDAPFCICPYHDCYGFISDCDHLEYAFSITDLENGGRCIISGKKYSVDAYLAVTPDLIQDIALSSAGGPLRGHEDITLDMKDGTFKENSVYRISARLLLRGDITTPDCWGGSTVQECWNARNIYGTRVPDPLENHIHELEVITHPVRLDLVSSQEGENIHYLTLPPLSLRHPLTTIPADLFTDEGSPIKAAVIREGEQVNVAWNLAQMPPPEAFGAVFLLIMRYDRTRGAWTDLQNYTLTPSDIVKGKARVLMDMHGARHRYLHAGFYKLWLGGVMGNNSEPVYVVVNQDASHHVPHYDFRLSRLTPAPDHHGMLLTLIKRSGDRFNGSLNFEVVTLSGPTLRFEKNFSFAGGSEPVSVTFRLPEDSDICAHEAGATYRVTLVGTDLWDERRIEGTFTLPAEYRSNIAFQAAAPVTVRQDDDNFGGQVAVTVNLAPHIQGRLCRETYKIHMRVSKPGGTVIFSKDQEVSIRDRRALFTIRPVSRLTDLSGGEKRLYFEALLDYEDQWAESDEGDNVRGTWFRLH